MYTYAYKHVITLKKKEAMNLNESEEGYKGTFEGGREREECCSYIIVSKTNKKQAKNPAL